MKVVAKHWVNYNGSWYKGGDEFEVDDFESIKEHADKKAPAEYVSDVFPPDEDVVAEAPKRRGRKPKTEE